MRMFFSVALLSGAVGTMPGRYSATRAALHLRTDFCTALTNAAGESETKFHGAPRSSKATVADGKVSEGATHDDKLDDGKADGNSGGNEALSEADRPRLALWPGLA